MAKILIVEDDQDIVETYTDLLSNRHHITAVNSASNGIKFSARIRPDIIILDLNLPGDSGVGVISFVRSYPAIAHTKIIVVSGFTEKIYKAHHISGRADLILAKPVDNQILLKAIDDLLVPM